VDFHFHLLRNLLNSSIDNPMKFRCQMFRVFSLIFKGSPLYQFDQSDLYIFQTIIFSSFFAINHNPLADEELWYFRQSIWFIYNPITDTETSKFPHQFDGNYCYTDFLQAPVLWLSAPPANHAFLTQYVFMDSMITNMLLFLKYKVSEY